MSNPLYEYARPSQGGDRSNPDGSSNDMPRLGATFVPGGFDDYFMPEVIAPAPQRVMPEVPQNIQNDLQRMEFEAGTTTPAHPYLPARQLDQANPPPIPAKYVPEPLFSPSPILSTDRGPSAPPAPTAAAAVAAAAAAPSTPSAFSDRHHGASNAGASANATAYNVEFKAYAQTNLVDMATIDVPSFSPFPKINQGNVPPSDDEKERILYNARYQVLQSNNVSVQLDWALDVLSWVEITSDAYKRENKDQGPRPSTPRIEHELRVDAINIVEYLAKQNHPRALFARAKWLEFGKFGFRQDRSEAFLSYRDAASRGWGRAEYRMGMIYENSNDIKNALLHYNRGLAMEDSAASYRLGMMNLLGQHGHTKDLQAGLDLIRAAADTSDEESPQGAYVFGILIARELPDISIPEGMLPSDVSQARQYIERSAYFGFAKAQLKMGQAYELCQLGCDFNPALSLHYYGLAAHQGQPEAALGVSRWFLFGYDGVFPKNEQLAFKYARQAADAKLATGEFAVGYYYEIGINVQKDLPEARKWYELAADHGNKDAINRLEGLRQAKTLTKQDHETQALTRIKSQHGSQRGRRPDRLRQKEPMPPMPSVAEAVPDEPAVLNDTDNAPPPPTKPSAQLRPESATPGTAQPPPPAFSISIDQTNLALRPKSTAPYPDDDRPSTVPLSRPKSTAPYPDDDVAHERLPLAPHYSPQIRPSSGQRADSRPLSAFGIRPVSMTPQPVAGRPLAASQSMGNIVPEPRPFSVNLSARPLDNEQRGRIFSAGWVPQVPGGNGHLAPRPGPEVAAGRGDYYDRPQGGPQQAPLQGAPPRLAGGMPPGTDPSRSRLSKPNPNAQPPGGYGPGGPGGPGGPSNAQPGRDYGPRTSSRPVSSAYAVGVGGNGRPDRIDSLPPQAHGGHIRQPSGGGRTSLPSQAQGSHGRLLSMGSGDPAFRNHYPQSTPLAPVSGNSGHDSRPTSGHSSGQHGLGRPVSTGQSPRISSASPARPPQPTQPVQQAQVPAKPAAKPAPKPTGGQGPATFEEMGIPQGKADDDCCIM